MVSAAPRSIRMIGNKAPADEATPKRQTRVWQGEPTIIARILQVGVPVDPAEPKPAPMLDVGVSASSR